MKNFFIISLPRCRTAWLANFLTTDQAFCHHELMRKVSNLDDYGYHLRGGIGHKAPDYDCVGDADPTLIPVLPQIIAAFPEAKFVFVSRSIEHVVQSFKQAFPRLLTSEAAMHKLAEQLDAAKKSIPEKQKLLVRFEDLNNFSCANAVHEFCLHKPCDRARWELLNEMRVTTIAEKAVATMAPWVKSALMKATYPLTPANEEWNNLMVEICGERQDALVWLHNLWHLALTWDHLTDGDPVDLARADSVFEAVLLEWPFNNFWKQFSPVLMPTLSNALSAWRYGGRAREYDIYSEMACAVAFALGGNVAAKKFAPRIRSCVAKLLAEDNARDNQS